MQIRVTGKDFDLPQRLKDEAAEKLSKVTKVFDRFLEMDVVFSEESNPRINDKYHCEVSLYAKGRTLRASAAAPDALTSMDRARAKLERQVRKLKTRLVSRSRQPAPEPSFAGAAIDEE